MCRFSAELNEIHQGLIDILYYCLFQHSSFSKIKIVIFLFYKEWLQNNAQVQNLSILR